jgi:hypothetical protein
VTDHGEQLRETFMTHETLAPDPAAVYARVQELSRIYQRRRRGAQVAGSAVLSAGLIAGVVQLPSVLAGHSGGAGIAAGAPGSPVPSVAASYAQPDLDRYWAAFFDAGYVWDDAVQLAALWKLPNPSDAKVAAGKKLEAGEKLPIEPKPANVAAARESAAVAKFFSAGYTYDDAVELAALWKLPDAYAAKVAGGEKLLAGQPLPIKP